MARLRSSRWLMVLLLAGLFLSLALGLALHLATRVLKEQVTEALGRNGEIGEIRVGWREIEILDLRIRASDGWPARDELRAKRVVIRPDLTALISSRVRISHIAIEEGYVSLLRRKDGRVLLLPSLMDRSVGRAGKTQVGDSVSSSSDQGVRVQLGAVALSGGSLEFFDATVRQKPHKITLEQVQARLGKIDLPALTGRTDIDIQGVVSGTRRQGRFIIKGDAEFASRDSDVRVGMRGVDLLAFQPYLIKAAETGVQRGTLDLELRSKVRQNRLHAPGTLTLTGLELSSGGSFMGLSRTTLIAALKDRKGRIVLNFVLQGDVNDPSFSLNESVAGQIGTALAGVLGISVEGLAHGLGAAGGTVVKGLGETVGKLFGRK